MHISNLHCPSSLCKTRGSRTRSHAGLSFIRRPGLSLKLLAIVIGVSLTGVLISSFLVLTLERQQLVDSARAANAHLSRAVEASLEHAMLTNDWTVVERIARSVGSGGAVDRVLILDRQGVARVSSLPAEAGARLERSEPVCQSCHVGAEPPGAQTVVTRQDGHEALVSISLLANAPACQACHDARDGILGYLLIETPLTDLQRQLQAGFWRMAGVAAATLALMVGLMVTALRMYVTRPVSALAEGLAAVGAGDLERRVPVASSDELGQLAAAFDGMRRQLKASRAETERHSQELAMLNEVALAAGQLLELQQILELALDIVVGRLGMETGSIYLCDERTGRFECRAYRGLTADQRRAIDRRRHEEPDWIPLIARTGEILHPPQMASDRRFQDLFPDMEERSCVYLPLRSRGAVVGTMGLVTHARQPLGERELAVLEAVGHEIGIAVDNAQLLAATRRGEREARALYELGARISASLELEQVLDTVADGARELLGAEAGMVALVVEEGRAIEVKAAAGEGARMLKGQQLPLAAGGLGEALARGEPYLGHEPGLTLLTDDAAGATCLAVPLARAGSSWGLLAVVSRAPRSFAPEEVRLLARLAQHVAVAIENAQLYRRVRRLAVLEERERLAREMHDNLAQSLGYLNLKASVTDWLLERQQFDEARSSLRELREASMSAYRDVREAIFSLRAAASAEAGFLPTLRDYLEEYHAHYGVRAELEVGGDGIADLPAEVGIQVTRIIQEALTNVRRHAGTERARVRIVQGDGGLEITIEDDGRGFDPAQAAAEGRQCFGLQVMRERAASVGGELELDSRPGEGTRVRVRVPLGAGK